MRISTRNFLGSTALVLSFGALWADAEAEIGRAREVVASYRSTVTEAELESWRRFENRPATSDWNLDLRELILLKSLAAEAERLGIDQRVDVKVAVELAQAPMVELAHRRELARTTEPSDAEVEAYYQRIKDIFTLPRRVRLRTVFKRYPLEADAVDKTIVLQEMKDLRRRAVAGEDFGELASEHSDSQTRFQKGLIGNVSQGTLDAKVDAIAMAMRPGEISDIIELPTGLTMLYCEKILPKVERTADELRSIARKRRTNQLLKKAWADNQTSWLEAAAPNYHWQVLDQRPLDKAAVLVVHRGGSLTVRQTEALVAPASLQELRREPLQTVIENYLRVYEARHEAEAKGLLDGELGNQLLWLRRKVLSTRTLLHHLERRFVPPTESEVREYFEQHRETFVRPEHYEVAAILLPELKDSNLREVFRAGELLLHRLHRGDLTFEVAAREYSRHPSANTGGQLGQLSAFELASSYGRTIRKAVQRLEPGGMSDLVREGDDLWILRLRAVETARKKTWCEARHEAEERCGGERVRELELQFRQLWLDSLQIEASKTQS